PALFVRLNVAVVLLPAMSPQALLSTSLKGSGANGVVKTYQLALPPLASAMSGRLPSLAMKAPMLYRCCAPTWSLTARSRLTVVPAMQFAPPTTVISAITMSLDVQFSDPTSRSPAHELGGKGGGAKGAKGSTQ